MANIHHAIVHRFRAGRLLFFRHIRSANRHRARHKAASIFPLNMTRVSTNRMPNMTNVLEDWMMKTNGIKQVTLVVVLALVGSQALAAKTTTLPEEKKGAVVGGLIGAALGGPIGAGAGAIVGGGWIGRALGTSRINADLRNALAAERREDDKQRGNLEAQIDQLGHALTKAEAAQHAASNLTLPIHFKTGSSEIEAHYQADLEGIAEALLKRPEARVDLSGFADRRGAADFNQKLSEQRVEQVRQFLVQHGVAQDQITVRAFGETRPIAAVETSESDFFDRRVVMHFELDGDQSPVAAR